MDGYYVVGVIAIQNPIFVVISNIVSKEDITYRVTNWQHLTLHMFGCHKNVLLGFGKEMETGLLQTSLLLYYLCPW